MNYLEKPLEKRDKGGKTSVFFHRFRGYHVPMHGVEIITPKVNTNLILITKDMTKVKSMYMRPSFICYQVNVEEGILLTSFEGDHDIIGNDNRNLEHDNSDEPDFNL